MWWTQVYAEPLIVISSMENFFACSLQLYPEGLPWQSENRIQFLAGELRSHIPHGKAKKKKKKKKKKREKNLESKEMNATVESVSICLQHMFWNLRKYESVSLSVLYDSLWPHGLWPTRLLKALSKYLLINLAICMVYNELSYLNPLEEKSSE